jgi:hypothetical protein
MRKLTLGRNLSLAQYQTYKNLRLTGFIIITIMNGLGALSLFIGLAPKMAAQSITITVGPATDDSYWVCF